MLGSCSARRGSKAISELEAYEALMDRPLKRALSGSVRDGDMVLDRARA